MSKTFLIATVFVLFSSVGLILLSLYSRGRVTGLGKTIKDGRPMKLATPYLTRAEEILALKALEMNGVWTKVKVVHLICGSVVLLVVGGAVFGTLLGNIPLAIVAAPIMAAIPWIILNLIGRRTSRNLQDQLEHAMGIVTNSYLRGQDIIGSIQDNIGEFNGYTEVLFRGFLTEVSLTDAGIATALADMRDKTANTYFKQWCTVLIQCLEDRELRFTLPPIVAEMGDRRGAVLEADTMIKKAQRDFFVILVIACMQLPIIGQVNPEWYRLLTDTTTGQVVTAVVFALCAICGLVVIKKAGSLREGV